MAEIGQKTDFTLKYIIVGNAAVGKPNNSYRFSKFYLLKNIKLQWVWILLLKILRPWIKILEFKYGILLGKKTSNKYLEVITKVVYVALPHKM